jgi:Uma2 family endonuclease
VLNPADVQPDRVRPLLRTEYDRLVASGAFDDERVELLDGMLVTMTPQDAAHAHTVTLLADVLIGALRGRALVRVQTPLGLLDISEPEPDIAVVPLADYSTEHPSEAHLVIEVAGSSLRRDRAVKGPIYARGGVPDYWLVDLQARIVEVHRDPGASGFMSITRHAENETLRPLRFADVEISIRNVLPRTR